MPKPSYFLEKDVGDELSWGPWRDDSQVGVKADDGEGRSALAVGTASDQARWQVLFWGFPSFFSGDGR